MWYTWHVAAKRKTATASEPALPPTEVTQGKRVPAIFFRTESGGEPLREWLKSLQPEDRKLIGEDIKTVEFGWPVGMPVCRSLGDAICEIRTHLTQGRIARFVYVSLYRMHLIAIHGWLKGVALILVGHVNHIIRPRLKLH